MRAYEELEILGIEKCLECGNNVGKDWDYVDFTNKTVVECPQCKERFNLIQTLEE